MEKIDNILELREFEEKNDSYIYFDIGMPAIVYECSANLRISSYVDELSRTILTFIKYGITSTREISKLLGVGGDIVLHIIKNKLEIIGFVDASGKISKNGEAFIEGSLKDEYSSERIYGNMFVNLIDGSVLPYFYEGVLPPALSIFNYDNEDLNIIYQPQRSSDTSFVYEPMFTEAYKKYNKILESYTLRATQNDIEENNFDEFDIISYGINDVLYLEENDDDDSCDEITTLVDIESRDHSKEFYVKVFKESRKSIYLKTRMAIDKRDPGTFVIYSPFNNNATSWYTKRLPYMILRENGIKIKESLSKETIDFADFIDSITIKTLNDYPELTQSNFDWLVATKFNQLNKLKEDRRVITEVLKKYYNSSLLFEAGNNTANEVLTVIGLAIETIENCYVKKIDIKKLKDNKLVVPHNSDITNAIFDYYGLLDCSGRKKGNDLERELKHWRPGKLIGGSAAVKYCALIHDAYFSPQKNSAFIQVMKRSNNEIIKLIDYIIWKRNKFTSHNDKEIVEEIPKADYQKVQEDFINATKLLIDGLVDHQEG